MAYRSSSRNFNPRLREGGDSNRSDQQVSNRNFNPRLREGGDVNGKQIQMKSTTISIHASAREATESGNRADHKGEFQSTPPRGRRRARSVHFTPLQSFQSTPPRGRRLRLKPRLIDRPISIHASAREATNTGSLHDKRLVISIHASAREATGRYE